MTTGELLWDWGLGVLTESEVLETNRGVFYGLKDIAEALELHLHVSSIEV